MSFKQTSERSMPSYDLSRSSPKPHGGYLPTSRRGMRTSPWLEMARAGNFYRHYYERVVDEFIWDTVQQSLGPLLAVVEQELGKLSGP